MEQSFKIIRNPALPPRAVDLSLLTVSQVRNLFSIIKERNTTDLYTIMNFLVQSSQDEHLELAGRIYESNRELFIYEKAH